VIGLRRRGATAVPANRGAGGPGHRASHGATNGGTPPAGAPAAHCPGGRQAQFLSSRRTSKFAARGPGRSDSERLTASESESESGGARRCASGSGSPSLGEPESRRPGGVALQAAGPAGRHPSPAAGRADTEDYTLRYIHILVTTDLKNLPATDWDPLVSSCGLSQLNMSQPINSYSRSAGGSRDGYQPIGASRATTGASVPVRTASSVTTGGSGGQVNTQSTAGRQTVEFLAKALQEEQEQRRQKERMLEQLLAEETVIFHASVYYFV
jgi:hypothetical protein